MIETGGLSTGLEMEEEQKKVYLAYSEHVKALIEKKVIDDEFKNSKIEILSYITKLRQIAIDNSLVMDKYNGKSGKRIQENIANSFK